MSKVVPRCSDEDMRSSHAVPVLRVEPTLKHGREKNTLQTKLAPEALDTPPRFSSIMPCPSAKMVNHRSTSGASPGLEPLRIAKPIPSFLDGSKHMFASNKLYLLLAFVPLAFLSEHLEWAPATVFGIACLAILPLAGLLGEATEQADR